MTNWKSNWKKASETGWDLNVNSHATHQESPREYEGPKAILLGLIRFYQMSLSRVLPPACRFTPSCSQYSHEAIARYGIIRGMGLAIKRIARCHPFNPGGYDPVPDLEEDT
jgi:hypothetical protein